MKIYIPIERVYDKVNNTMIGCHILNPFKYVDDAKNEMQKHAEWAVMGDNKYSITDRNDVHVVVEKWDVKRIFSYVEKDLY